MSQISLDRKPSNDAIREFRAKHREISLISFKKAKIKDRAKFKGEIYDHVEGSIDILNDVKRKILGTWLKPAYLAS